MTAFENAEAVRTMTNRLTKDLERLDGVLETFGADRLRWPADVRRELATLMASSEEAKRRMREAEAFDRLLDTAPQLSGDRIAALTDRIMAGAARTPRMAVSNTIQKPATRAPVWRRHAGGMAALAASLMIGILAGQSQTMTPAVSEVAALAGFDLESAGQQVAQTDEADVSIDEDLL